MIATQWLTFSVYCLHNGDCNNHVVYSCEGIVLCMSIDSPIPRLGRMVWEWDWRKCTHFKFMFWLAEWWRVHESNPGPGSLPTIHDLSWKPWLGSSYSLASYESDVLTSHFWFPESGHNFSHYLNRFSMPSTSSPHWYSWDIARVHFIRSACHVTTLPAVLWSLECMKQQIAIQSHIDLGILDRKQKCSY